MFYDGKKSGSHFVQAEAYGFSLMYGWYQDMYLNKLGVIDHAGANYFRAVTKTQVMLAKRLAMRHKES